MNDTSKLSSKNESPHWERETIEKVLLASIEEQRRARRWGIFFKACLGIYLLVALWLAAEPVLDTRAKDGKDHTAVIDVSGTIASGQPASAEHLIEGLKDAVESKGTRGIVLRMNTPGGSPVQSAYVYNEIRRIKKLKPELPIYAVVSDICTSGGYYIASAADKIYVNEASLIGSIGVIMGSFGFVEAMNRLGVERRVMTSGSHKALFDPFSPVDTVAKAHLQSTMNLVHQQFIEAVKKGRGKRLKEDTPELFSGLVWTGAQGIELGLADALGDDRYIAEEVIGAKKIVSFNPEEKFLDRITHRFGTAIGQVFWNMLGITLR